jgi:hypothetical protein
MKAWRWYPGSLKLLILTDIRAKASMHRAENGKLFRFPLVALVPKLLAVLEAPASSLAKLELGDERSQAGAWERA